MATTTTVAASFDAQCAAHFAAPHPQSADAQEICDAIKLHNTFRATHQGPDQQNFQKNNLPAIAFKSHSTLILRGHFLIEFFTILKSACFNSDSRRLALCWCSSMG